MFLVQKRLFCILPCNKSTIHLSSLELCSLFSFSTSKDQSSDHKSNFIVVDPLQSCDLTSEKVVKTANCHTCHTKSSSSSLSIEFFKQSGWTDAQVVKLMQKDPRILPASSPSSNGTAPVSFSSTSENFNTKLQMTQRARLNLNYKLSKQLEFDLISKPENRPKISMYLVRYNLTPLCQHSVFSAVVLKATISAT
ncbi:unnamed protein product [Musa hybrid cultivar]